MKYDEAFLLADKLLGELSPFCHRIEIAGSVRRKKPECGDIEIVCIPKKGTMRNKKTGSLLPTMEYIQTVDRYKAIKGKAWDKYTQRILIPAQSTGVHYETFNLDLFTANEDNWGYIMAIRTGPAEYSHEVLAKGWVRAGFHGKDGYLWDRDNTLVPVLDERHLYNLIGIEYCEPENRRLIKL